MKHIMLVSSSPTFLDRNRKLLNRTEFNILTAASGQDALRLRREHTVDLIVAELQLDDMGGDRLCALLRGEQQGGDTPLVLICRELAEEVARVKESGANDWVTRPVKPLQLLKTVGRFLTVEMIRSKRVPLKVKVFTKLGFKVFICSSSNVSVTGMLLESDSRLEQEELIVCRFDLPGFGMIEADAEVVRVVRSLDGTYQYGVHFETLSTEHRRQIDRYVCSVSRDNA
jgi:CheY-like chemotaxis protein